MEMRCPVCKADKLQSPQCRRCKADLTLLVQLLEQRRLILHQGRLALQAGRWQEAETAAQRAHQLARDAESSQLLALAAVLQGKYHQAWQLYRQSDINPA